MNAYFAMWLIWSLSIVVVLIGRLFFDTFSIHYWGRDYMIASALKVWMLSTFAIWLIYFVVGFVVVVFGLAAT